MVVAWTRVAAVQVGEVTDSRDSLRGGVQENLKSQGDSKTFCLRTCKDRKGGRLCVNQGCERRRWSSGFGCVGFEGCPSHAGGKVE